jgi:hypothetical protein
LKKDQSMRVSLFSEPDTRQFLIHIRSMLVIAIVLGM